MQKITTNLWFDKEAEQAAHFYTSIFRNSRILRITHYGKAGYDIHGQPEGQVLTVLFEIEGQKFVALNGGPHFKFNEAVSFIINCDSQEEVDYYWDKLGENGGGIAQQCGWLKDRYGVSWQIVPTLLAELLSDEDKTKSERVMNTLLAMKKLDINL